MRARSLSLILVVLTLVAWPSGTVPATAAGGSSSAVAAASTPGADPTLNVWIDSTVIAGGDTYETGRDPTFTVRAAVGDGRLAGSNLTEVVVMVDGKTAVTRSTWGPNVAEEIDLDLVGGEHQIRVIVTDDAENTESVRFTVVKDADPPMLFLTKPYETGPWDPIRDGTVAGRNVTLAGKVVEDSDLRRIQIRHTYGDYERTYVFRDVERAFSLPLELGYSREGNRTNDFHVTAVDEYGNVRSYDFGIESVDGAEPTVSFRPTPDETTRSRVFVSGSVGDDVWIDEASVTLRRPEGSRSGFQPIYRPRTYEFTVDRRTGRFNQSLYMVRPGVYEATVSVTDVAGKTTTRTVQIRRLERDLDPTPTVEIDRDRTVVLGSERLFVSGVSHEGITTRLTVETRNAGTGDTIDYRVVHAGGKRASVPFDREIDTFDGRTEVIVRATDPTGEEAVTRFFVDGSRRATFVGGGNGSEGDGGNGTPTGSGPVVRIDPLVDDRPATRSASVAVRGADAGSTVALAAGSLRSNVTSTPAFGVAELGVSVTAETSFTATVSARDRNAGTLARPPETEPVGTATVQHSLTAASVSGVALTLRVDRTYLDDSGVDPADLAVYRLSGGTWSRLPTRQVRTTATDIYYRADSPGLSVFALAAGSGTTDGWTPGNGTDWQPQFDSSGNGSDAGGSTDNGTDAGGNATDVGEPQIRPVETTVNRTEVEVNESVRVNATLENSGTANGTYVAGFYTRHGLDRSFVGKRPVEVPAGERRTVSFVTSFQRAGNYTVSVNGTQGGPVTVSSGGGGGLLSFLPFSGVFSVFSFLSFLPLELIGMAIGGLVGLYLVLVLVQFVLGRVGGGGESAGG